jgi:peptidoglycan LD-endopeptidase LytH
MRNRDGFPRWRARARARVRATAAALAAALLVAGCGQIQQLSEPFRPQTAHERYAEGLRGAGLAGSALGRDWLVAAERALAEAHPVPLPFREAGYFPAEEARAVGYRIRAERGQRLEVRVEVEGAEPPHLFVDLFEVPEDTARPPAHRASADSGALTLEWEPRRDAEVVLRLQPELLRAARYVVTVRSRGALAFPVDGRDSRAIGSGFGAARDGGARTHHGVDVFAPRGTPVLASAAGVVTRVEETGRGGRVVWLQDAERGLSLYYAHLDTQQVQPGTRVQPGDTLGTVGNTGNARTTPPHLHFGIYRRGEGPIDPQPWVHTARAAPPEPALAPGRLGGWARVAAREAALQAEPSARASGGATLARHTPLRVMGASGGWYRVLLPDGRTGYVAGRSTETTDRPIRRERLAGALRDRPLATAAAIDTLRSDAPVPVLGRFNGFLLVEAPDGRSGWVAAE